MYGSDVLEGQVEFVRGNAQELALQIVEGLDAISAESDDTHLLLTPYEWQ